MGGKDATERFPELSRLPARLAPRRATFDGEVVAFDDRGLPSLGMLQHRMQLARPSDVARVPAEIPACYVVFDLLWLDDEDLTGFAYLDRRHLLVELVEPRDGLLVPAHQLGGYPTARHVLADRLVATLMRSIRRP